MNKKFIVLTKKNDDSEVIIGLSNIALIEKSIPKNENSDTIITLNFAKNNDFATKTITVKQTFIQIKSMLNL